MPSRAEPGEGADLLGQGQEREGERDHRGQEHAEDGVGDEEDSQQEGQADPARPIEHCRCHGNETAHARDRSTASSGSLH